MSVPIEAGPGYADLLRSWLDLTRQAMRAEGVGERAVDRVVHRMVFGCSVEEADRGKTMGAGFGG